MTENPWGDLPSTIPPIVSEPRTASPTPAARREDRRRFRLAAGGIATLVAVGGVAYAQTTHGATATAATTTTSGTTSTTTSGSSSGTSSGVSVGSSSGTGQTTSAGS
jgi:hypothetical protein